jgi:hypothetical protein
MWLMRPVILVGLLCRAASASEGQAWSYVPAARDAQTFSGFVLPDIPTESAVALVGANPVAIAHPTEARRVFAIEIPKSPEERMNQPPLADMSAPAVPAEAYWPDAHGRIIAGAKERGNGSKAVHMRNPWELRIAPKTAGRDTVFECGGVIIGGEGGSVALLNGRVSRRGDLLGEFSVAAVLANGVMLERNGLYFVIPRGRRTTVTTLDG